MKRSPRIFLWKKGSFFELDIHCNGIPRTRTSTCYLLFLWWKKVFCHIWLLGKFFQLSMPLLSSFTFFSFFLCFRWKGSLFGFLPPCFLLPGMKFTIWVRVPRRVGTLTAIDIKKTPAKKPGSPRFGYNHAFRQRLHYQNWARFLVLCSHYIRPNNVVKKGEKKRQEGEIISLDFASCTHKGPLSLTLFISKTLSDMFANLYLWGLLAKNGRNKCC